MANNSEKQMTKTNVHASINKHFGRGGSIPIVLVSIEGAYRQCLGHLYFAKIFLLLFQLIP